MMASTKKPTSQNRVTHAAWQSLYDAAMAFKDLACWEWMYDSDLFGVQNPETGEVGYCCVLGNLGEVLALNVYLGTEGLKGYWALYDQDGPPEQNSLREAHRLLTAQLCLMASFEDRADLNKKDLDVIRSLGLKFRGRQAWPLFRSYRPAYEPWFLTPPEVAFLTLALEQATEVAAQYKTDPTRLTPPGRDGSRCLVRVCEAGKWKDTWQRPADEEPPQVPPVIDEILLERIRKADYPRQSAWIADCLLLPTLITEGERPYYPYAFPILSEEGFILKMEMVKPGDESHEFPNQFLDLIQQVESLPQVLVVGSQKAFELLEPIAERLGIPLQQEQSLPPLDDFLDSLEEYLGRG